MQSPCAHAAEPFCYMVSLPDPHGPNTVRAPYDTMYDDVHVPIPVSLNRTPEQIPNWGKPAGVTPAQLRRLMRQYYGMVKCIDDNVGRLLDELRERDLLERTVVVFTSDHGDLCGEHGRLNKGVPYEGSARVPFLIACPGRIPPGTTVDEALGCVDFLPTIMSLLDVPMMDHAVDGRDASALFTTRDVEWDDVAFVRSTPGAPWLSVITAQFKLVYSTNDQPWLIDLQEDPNELTNLIGHTEHAELVRQLTERLVAYGEMHDDEYIEHPRMRAWIDQVLGQ